MVLFLPTAQAGLSGSGEVFYPVKASTFGGSAYLTNSAAVISDSQLGLVSLWFNKGSLAANEYFVYSVPATANPPIAIWKKNANNRLQVDIFTTDTQYFTFFVTTFSTYEDSAWHHLLMSWSIPLQAGYVYIDGVQKATLAGQVTVTPAGAPSSFDVATKSGTSNYNGSLSELYYISSYLDISILANRRLFYTASKRP